MIYLTDDFIGGMQMRCVCMRNIILSCLLMLLSIACWCYTLPPQVDHDSIVKIAIIPISGVFGGAFALHRIIRRSGSYRDYDFVFDLLRETPLWAQYGVRLVFLFGNMEVLLQIVIFVKIMFGNQFLPESDAIYRVILLKVISYYTALIAIAWWCLRSSPQ